jgi:hypothetical protein
MTEDTIIVNDDTISPTPDVNVPSMPENPSETVIDSNSQKYADKAAVAASGVHHLNMFFKAYSDAANAVIAIIDAAERSANWTEEEVKTAWHNIFNKKN